MKMICFMNVEAQMSSGPISATEPKALYSTVPDGIVIVICTCRGGKVCMLSKWLDPFGPWRRAMDGRMYVCLVHDVRLRRAADDL